MIYLKAHELIETVRFGFGLRLKVSVENGTLVYRSNGHIWQCGWLRLTFPDWLVRLRNPFSNAAYRQKSTDRKPHP
jgi:hypothetical protein